MHVSERSGFRNWLLQKQAAIRYRICWFTGHRWNASAWTRSPYTVATHRRTHTCERCGLTNNENGYFDALKYPEMYRSNA